MGESVFCICLSRVSVRVWDVLDVLLLGASSEQDLNNESWARGPWQGVAVRMYYNTIHYIHNTTIKFNINIK